VPLWFNLCLGSCAPPRRAAAVPAPHPLDPLSGAEITAAVRALKGYPAFPKEGLFPVFSLREPAKEEVLHYTPGQPFAREAFAVVLDRTANRTFEAVIDLRAGRVSSWKEVPGVQPMLLGGEYNLVPKLVRADARWQAAMRRRGIQDFENVMLDLWAPGYLGPEEAPSRRLIRALSFYRGNASSPYARPVEGVITLVDANHGRVAEVIDRGVVPLAAGGREYAGGPPGRARPPGPGFSVQGHEVRWQNWRFRWTLDPREGLVLYTVGYQDGGRLRSILYRGSLSEMIVPYADPDPSWSFRSAFDVGEYGIGRWANSLVPGQDAPDNATFFDATFADDDGTPAVQPRAAALYERDGGLLWRHYDEDMERTAARRARELVLSFTTTSGNYDYAFNWVFRPDGSMGLEALLSGIMLPKGVRARQAGGHGEGAAERYGHLVAPNVLAVSHQHFFNFRLDMDVDGPSNTVVEMETHSAPAGPENPLGNVFFMTEQPLVSELKAERDLDLAANRLWKVINPQARNALGQPAGFILLPGENAVPYARPESVIRRRAGFLDHHLWVTPYAPDERYAAGEYVNQSAGGEGLPKWTRADRPLENRDVVLWYTMGVTHLPRPEEWPVMPAHRAGFQLLPAAFFDRNPALAPPPSR
jgi:primary-amine oxidase